MKIPAKKTNVLRWILVTMLPLIMTACAGDMNNIRLEENSKPTVITPPTIGTPMSATVMSLKTYDYEEKEYFIQNTASRYRIKDKLKDAQFIDSGYPYTTRILVRKPNNPAKFNGTVIVEWLNVSLDQDVDFVFGATRELVVREGYAWIGVSAQKKWY